MRGSRIRGALAAAIAALGCAQLSLLALPIITDVQVLEGADGVELPPMFTGQTFDHPNEGAGFTVPLFGEEAPAYNDRNHEWNGATTDMPLPGYLVGGEYIMFPNDDRDNNPYLVEITLSTDAEVYLLIDNRLPDNVNTTPPDLSAAMFWVTEDGWEPVRNGLNRRGNPDEPDEVGVDESGDATGPGGSIQQWSSVYYRRIPAGTFTVGTAENPGRNMYGIVVKPVPLRPHLSGASGDLLGVVFDITKGSNTDLNPSSVRLVVDGTDVTAQAQLTTMGDVTRVRYRPAEPFPSLSAHTATITFSDTGTPPQELTSTIEFTAEYYATLTAADQAPAGSVNTSSSGFTARIAQARDTAGWPSPDLPNTTVRAELQLAGILRDPINGGFIQNFAIPGPNPDGSYTVERVNWNQEMNEGGNFTEIGNFQSTTTPSFPDEPIPGIPGTDPDSAANRDNIAGEIIGYLELPAGVHRLGVNSDDGFRFTAGSDPRNPGNVVLGQFEGGRGSANSLFYVKVEEAGIYPVRVIWYEGGGGANLEIFSVHQPNPDGEAEFIPLNTRSNPNSIDSYASSSAAEVARVTVYPLGNSTGVPANAPLRAVISPASAASNAGLTVNGAAVNATSTTIPAGLLVEHTPADLWPSGSTNVVVLSYTAGGQQQSVTWQFVVEDYSNFPVIPAGYAVPANAINMSASGFIVDMYQMWDGFSFTPTARTGFADNNSPEAAEMQIARGYIDPNTGEPYARFYGPEGENPDGTFNIEIINWNQQYADAGDFNASNGYEDALIPGIVYDGDVPENDWIVAEALTYLQLSKGRHRLGVNSDDGFKVTTSPNPGDVVGLQLGSFNTGRGAANTFFDFIVEEDGFYPFRLLWWEGTGGASVEFKSQDPVTQAQTLINDRARQDGIRAFRTYTGPAIPRIASVSPAAGSADNPVDATISVGLENIGNATVALRVNGEEVQTQRATQGNITTLTYQTPQPFPSGSAVNVELVRAGTTASWSFQVGESAENLVTVAITAPASNAKLPEGPTTVTLTADANAQGATIQRVQFFDGSSNSLGQATSAPFTVQWANVPSGRYTVFAVATDSRGLTAGSGRVQFQVGTPIAINFQDATAEPPEGYLPDYGDVFGDRGNGYTYGWDEDNTANARNRNDARAPDERYDTFNHWQKPAPAGSLWEIEVPNGWYNVFLAAGEASNIDSVYDVTAEGVTIVKGTPTDAVRFYEGMGTVQVTDGRLSIGNGPTASNNKVAFVEIYKGSEPASEIVIAPPALSGGSITINWTGGGTLESADALGGEWTSTGDSDGSYSEPTTGAQRYFRVRR